MYTTTSGTDFSSHCTAVLPQTSDKCIQFDVILHAIHSWNEKTKQVFKGQVFFHVLAQRKKAVKRHFLTSLLYLLLSGVMAILLYT